MINTKRKTLTLEILFLLFIFALYFAFSVLNPGGQAPDEHMRNQMAGFIFDHGKLPHGGDPSLRNPIWGISYGFTPVLSYMISAVFMKITSLFTVDGAAMLLAARFTSVVCGTVSAFFYLRISKQLFKGSFRWLFVIFCTLLPQLVFINSYVNSDSLGIMSGTIIVYAWILGLKRKWDIKSCILLAVGISICALSYYNAYGFILCSIILFLASYLWLYRKEKYFKQMLSRALIIIAIVAVLAGWWFIRSAILYNGDFIGMKTSDMYAQRYAQHNYKPSNILTPEKQGIPVITMLVSMKWLITTARGFVAAFGNADLPFPNPILYIPYIMIFATGIIGVIYSLKNIPRMLKSEFLKRRVLFNIVMFIAMIIPIILAITYSYSNDFQPQGRYVMPMILPFMYFVVMGIQQLADRFIKSKKARNITIATIGIFYALMPIYSLVFVIYPKYH